MALTSSPLVVINPEDGFHNFSAFHLKYFTCSYNHSLAEIALSNFPLHNLGETLFDVQIDRGRNPNLCSLEKNVLSLMVVVELDIFIGDGHLGDGDGLPSQHGLVDNAGPVHQHRVHLDGVAPVDGKQDKVSGHQLRRR